MQNLYPHNQQAVDAIRAHYAAGNTKAAVVHATGTGKSYIIASVTADYKRALIIAPNNFVLNETRNVCHPGCTFRTYASVMYDEGDHDAYDIIVLDEFHRGGAEKWGGGVSRIIEANPQALLLGTSATHIRYLDGQRNMADELFDGQVVSQLPLKDAISQGILPNPTYVSSIYSIDETVRSRKQKIANSNRKDLDKDDLCRRLDGIAHNWENAGGVPHIIHKYFSHDMQRVIVFCSKVKRAAEARQLLSRWFGLAGFKRVRYYNIDYKEKRLEREMEDFQQPLGEYDLKVAISVNMLNEGVHVPHVDGIIMLRSTISRIIIEQQVGRCLTSNNVTITPVVLDLVNNMDLIRYDEPIFTGEFDTDPTAPRQEHHHHVFPFHVIDECRDLRVLLSQLDNEINKPSGYWTLDMCKNDALKYKTRSEWQIRSRFACEAARRHGWFEECCAHMPVPFRWTIEAAREAAKCATTRKELRRKNNGCENWIRKNNLWEECAPHLKPAFRYDYDYLKKLAKQYDDIKDFIKDHKKEYCAINERGYSDEFFAHMKRRVLRKKYTKEECRNVALQFTCISGLDKSNHTIREYIRRHGWDKELFSHMTRKCTVRTIEECKEIALKYKDANEFFANDRAVYWYCQRMKWMDQVCAHMPSPKRDPIKNRWTLERAIETARQYSSRKELDRKESWLYKVILKNGWQDECFSHMPSYKRKK